MQTLIIVESYRQDGKVFRPSDWIERICSTLAEFGSDHRLHYMEGVSPRVVNGERCLVMAKTVSESHPEVYRYVMDFVISNNLRVREE